MPTASAIAAATEAMIADAAASGRRPTVSELARRLGLTNTTFWRHFPDIAAQIAAQGRASTSTPTTPIDSPQDRQHALAQENQDLRANLALAIAHIQRLTIENEQLRIAVEDHAQVVRLPRHRSGDGTGH
jgi:AcrR family transcriptional regulator